MPGRHKAANQPQLRRRQAPPSEWTMGSAAAAWAHAFSRTATTASGVVARATMSPAVKASAA
jgi:hypothetical protein